MLPGSSSISESDLKKFDVDLDASGTTLPVTLQNGKLHFKWDADRNNGRIVEANVAYQIDTHWGVNANYSYLHMENPVLAAPESKLFAGVNYSRDRWAFNTGVQWISGLYTAVGDNAQKESFVLWNADVNYRLSSFVTLYVKGENLLAQKYEINAGFPMPKATFMGGIHLSF